MRSYREKLNTTFAATSKLSSGSCQDHFYANKQTWHCITPYLTTLYKKTMKDIKKRKTFPGSTYSIEYIMVQFSIFETRPFFMVCGSCSFLQRNSAETKVCDRMLETSLSNSSAYHKFKAWQDLWQKNAHSEKIAAAHEISLRHGFHSTNHRKPFKAIC